MENHLHDSNDKVLSMMGRSASRRLLVGATLSAAGYLLLAGGCRPGPPAKTVPVTGKLTYEDGSLIQAQQIMIQFVPQGISDSEGRPILPSRATVNRNDGSFELSTWRAGDGAPVGKYKIAISALGEGRRLVLDKVFDNPMKTPLTAEVFADKPNVIQIKVLKKK